MAVAHIALTRVGVGRREHHLLERLAHLFIKYFLPEFSNLLCVRINVFYQIIALPIFPPSCAYVLMCMHTYTRPQTHNTECGTCTCVCMHA